MGEQEHRKRHKMNPWDAIVYTNITIGRRWTVYRSGPEATVSIHNQWQRRAVQVSKNTFDLMIQLWIADDKFTAIAVHWVGKGNEATAVRWVARGVL